jgi:CubicO group peptidase (beta-lactamase class C family)
LTQSLTPSGLRAAAPDQIDLSGNALGRLTAAMEREIAAARVPGVAMAIARGGRLAYRHDLGSLRPGGPELSSDAIFRIYSMTKPIVSVALMMLVEDGRLFLGDPIGKFIPALADMKVGVERDGILELQPAECAFTIQDLLRHTSGLTYAFTGNSAVQRRYSAAKLFTGDPANARVFLTHDLSNAEFVIELAKLPLIAQPGASWDYGHSTDVIGRVIEIVSGQTLAAFLSERIFTPLGMTDTAFYVPAEKLHRLAESFPADPDGGPPVALIDGSKPPRFESGGGGLFSTVDDYLRFALMLYGRGRVGDVQILGRKTVELMTADHLAPDVRIAVPTLLQPGHGFGLGFAVRRSAGLALTPGTPGEFFWGGVAGTYFWIAPREELIAIMMIQAPRQRDYYRQLFRTLVYAALE